MLFSRQSWCNCHPQPVLKAAHYYVVLLLYKSQVSLFLCCSPLSAAVLVVPAVVGRCYLQHI
jgi:hypothetical protein